MFVALVVSVVAMGVAVARVLGVDVDVGDFDVSVRCFLRVGPWLWYC